MSLKKTIWRTTKADAAMAAYTSYVVGRNYNGLDFRFRRLGIRPGNPNGRVILANSRDEFHSAVDNLYTSNLLNAAGAPQFAPLGYIWDMVRAFNTTAMVSGMGGAPKQFFILNSSGQRVKEFMIVDYGGLSGSRALFHAIQRHSTDAFEPV